MRIDMATCGENIPPRFDCASTLRVLESTGSAPSMRCDYCCLSDAGFEVVAGRGPVGG